MLATAFVVVSLALCVHISPYAVETDDPPSVSGNEANPEIKMELHKESIPSYIRAGDTFRIWPEKNGVKIEDDIVFSSSDPQYLSVDNEGLVTAHGLCTATLRAENIRTGEYVKKYKSYRALWFDTLTLEPYIDSFVPDFYEKYMTTDSILHKRYQTTGGLLVISPYDPCYELLVAREYKGDLSFFHNGRGYCAYRIYGVWKQD